MKLKNSLAVMMFAFLFAPCVFAEQNEYHALRRMNDKYYDTEPLKNGESHNRRYVKKKPASVDPSSSSLTEPDGGQREVSSEPASNVEEANFGSQKRKYSGTR